MVYRVKEALKDFALAGKLSYQGQYSYRAAALAFTTLLSLVPMVSISLYIIAKFPIFPHIHSLTRSYLVSVFLPASSTEIMKYLNDFSQHATQLPAFSILFLFLTSLVMATAIDQSMHNLWQNGVKTKSLLSYVGYALIILLMPLFIELGAIINYLIIFVFKFLSVVKVIGFVAPLVLNALILVLLYIVTSSIRVKWSDALVGGFIAAVLLEIAKFGFTFYILLFSNYETLYGPLAVLPAFLIWLYIFWLIVFYGALIVKVRYKKQNRRLNG